MKRAVSKSYDVFHCFNWAKATKQVQRNPISDLGDFKEHFFETVAAKKETNNPWVPAEDIHRVLMG